MSPKRFRQSLIILSAPCNFSELKLKIVFDYQDFSKNNNLLISLLLFAYSLVKNFVKFLVQNQRHAFYECNSVFFRGGLYFVVMCALCITIWRHMNLLIIPFCLRTTSAIAIFYKTFESKLESIAGVLSVSTIQPYKMSKIKNK